MCRKWEISSLSSKNWLSSGVVCSFFVQDGPGPGELKDSKESYQHQLPRMIHHQYSHSANKEADSEAFGKLIQRVGDRAGAGQLLSYLSPFH